MELFATAVVSTIIASAAYVYAPIARIHVARRFRVPLPAGVVTPEAEAVSVPQEPLPPAVERLIDSESELFARIELRDAAFRLYAEHGDWNMVLQELERI